MLPTPTKAITLDVGGTLITPCRSVGHIYSQVAAGHGCIGLPPELLNERFAAAWKNLKDFQHSRAQWAALVDTTFFGLIETLPSQTFFDELYELFAQPASWRIFNDVIPVLSALRSRGFKLGVISNWDERLRPLLCALELSDYFEAIAVSCEVGSSKPSRKVFLYAAGQLGVPPQMVLHVGDSVEMDCQGAQAAGFAATWLNRSSSAGGPGSIHSLKELLAQVPPVAADS